MTKETIELKKKKLAEVIEKLSRYKKLSFTEFLEDTCAQDAVMHNLVIGIEAITDIGNFILSKYFNEVLGTYRDIILKLGEHRVIPHRFAKNNAAMADFRNLLIHIYESVDMERVYDYVKKAPNIFQKFTLYFTKFLERQKNK